MLWIDEIPPARLRRYHNFFKQGTPNLSDYKAVYLWNIALGKAMYPLLALFEVTLRNRIDCALQKMYGEHWLDPSWSGWTTYKDPQGRPINLECKKLIQTTARLQEENKRLPTHDQLVADLTLGFWCKLLSHPYRQSVWYKNIALKKYLFQTELEGLEARNWLNRVYPKFQEVLKVRNRVFHHEPVFDSPRLSQFYNESKAVLFAMAPGLEEALNFYPEFEAVWQDGDGWRRFKQTDS